MTPHDSHSWIWVTVCGPDYAMSFKAANRSPGVVRIRRKGSSTDMTSPEMRASAMQAPTIVQDLGLLLN